MITVSEANRAAFWKAHQQVQDDLHRGIELAEAERLFERNLVEHNQQARDGFASGVRLWNKENPPLVPKQG